MKLNEECNEINKFVSFLHNKYIPSGKYNEVIFNNNICPENLFINIVLFYINSSFILNKLCTRRQLQNQGSEIQDENLLLIIPWINRFVLRSYCYSKLLLDKNRILRSQ